MCMLQTDSSSLGNVMYSVSIQEDSIHKHSATMSSMLMLEWQPASSDTANILLASILNLMNVLLSCKPNPIGRVNICISANHSCVESLCFFMLQLKSVINDI